MGHVLLALALPQVLDTLTCSKINVSNPLKLFNFPQIVRQPQSHKSLIGCLTNHDSEFKSTIAK